MRRLTILVLMAPALLAGCGEVIMFGHVVREKPAPPEAKSDATPSVGAPPAATTAAPAAAATPAVATTAAPAPAAAPPAATAAAAATPGVPALPTTPPPAAVAAPVTVPGPTATAVAAPPRNPAAVNPASAQSSAAVVVTSVHVSFTSAAAAKVAGDSNVGTDALAAEINSELRARRLLDEQNPRAHGAAEVIVDDLSSHPTSNAVFFGYQMMAATLTGEVRVTAADGTDPRTFRIAASSRWNAPADSADKIPLKPLYHRFAVQTGDHLAGTPAKDGSSPDSGSP